LLLSGSTSGTSLTGYVTKNRGGIGSPIPVPGVVIDAVGGVFPTVANYSVGDLLLDIVNQIGYVRDPTNWQRFT
jgi:hypothetical protein